MLKGHKAQQEHETELSHQDETTQVSHQDQTTQQQEHTRQEEEQRARGAKSRLSTVVNRPVTGVDSRE